MVPTSEHHAVIPAVPAGVERPLWSVMIPTYNCASYLRETLTSVLEQDPGPDQMQIEVVDDHSTKDDPEAVVRELGKGRVAFFRQPENVGHVRNFESCLQRARGYLIHQLHGDDVVMHGFYRKMQEPFETHPEIGAAFCRYAFMDDHGIWTWISEPEQRTNGILEKWIEKMGTCCRIQTPAMVVRREVYEKLGGFDRRLSWCEDWEMWTRIAAHYPVWYVVEPLAIYREHQFSSTGRHMKNGSNFEDLQRVFGIIREHLPPDKADALLKLAAGVYAGAAMVYARRAFLAGDHGAMRAQMKGAWRLNPSFSVFRKACRLGADYLAAGLRHKMRSRRLKPES